MRTCGCTHTHTHTHTGGRYRSQHALQHFVDSGHSFAIELGTQRVCACFHHPWSRPLCRTPLPHSNEMRYSSVKSYPLWYLWGPVVESYPLWYLRGPAPPNHSVTNTVQFHETLQGVPHLGTSIRWHRMCTHKCLQVRTALQQVRTGLKAVHTRSSTSSRVGTHM